MTMQNVPYDTMHTAAGVVQSAAVQGLSGARINNRPKLKAYDQLLGKVGYTATDEGMTKVDQMLAFLAAHLPSALAGQRLRRIMKGSKATKMHTYLLYAGPLGSRVTLESGQDAGPQEATVRLLQAVGDVWDKEPRKCVRGCRGWGAAPSAAIALVVGNEIALHLSRVLYCRSNLPALKQLVIEAVCLAERHLSVTELDIKLHNLTHIPDVIKMLGACVRACARACVPSASSRTCAFLVPAAACCPIIVLNARFLHTLLARSQALRTWCQCLRRRARGAKWAGWLTIAQQCQAACSTAASTRS
jgi:hypothetical protein